MAIISGTPITMTGIIHNGQVIHHQDQSIVPVSLRMTATKNSRKKVLNEVLNNVLEFFILRYLVRIKIKSEGILPVNIFRDSHGGLVVPEISLLVF